MLVRVSNQCVAKFIFVPFLLDFIEGFDYVNVALFIVVLFDANM